ncbi:hypothetical protein BDA99DRAFT_64873 [Phascolomyces articulosus]|uniref:BZIP domain-containing protein n=1 Tax=Phascolomyces articulosus TaxID=60185 RepID=A0AAD5PE06_9FUNG|nr:hypothetical protein BDA99DRAFT_64873 [Phascolomyces articulosus]
MESEHDMDTMDAMDTDVPEDQYDTLGEGDSIHNDAHTDNDSQPVKIRKKPGRKPNPASPALRKAQNRAAQRAFRERKEKHLRELEVAIKQVREQRDKLHNENEQLKSENDILKSENWYLKGIVLSLQLVCFQHNLTIPQHGPYINDQTLSLLAQSIPEPIAAYLDVNSKSKLPTFSKVYNNNHHRRQQRDRYVSSGSILITEDGVRAMPNRQRSQPPPPPPPSLQQHVAAAATSPAWEQPTPSTTTESSNNSVDLNDPNTFPSPSPSISTSRDDQQQRISLANLPDLSPVQESKTPEEENRHHQQRRSNNNSHHYRPNNMPKPVMLTDEPLTSNLAAIQALRLRLRLQAACVRMSSLPFAIQPTLLQLTIPHDPRIDLIPTPHMRDRMILFRDQFSLDDCFRCLLSGSVFHGGDPAIAGNWELPVEFFEKYWFLTIDFSLQRTTNRWRRMQGLEEVNPFSEQDQTTTSGSTSTTGLASDAAHITTVATVPSQPSLESATRPQPQITVNDLSSFLGIDLNRDKILQNPSLASTTTSTLTHNNTNNTTSFLSTSPTVPNQQNPNQPPPQLPNPSVNNSNTISPITSGQTASYPSSLSSTSTAKSKSTASSVDNNTGDEMFSPTPIQLTNGYYGMHYTPRNSVGQKTTRFNAPEQRCTTWDSLIANDNGKFFFLCYI